MFRSVIIEKHYRSVINRSVVEYFMSEVNKGDHPLPVMSLPKLVLIHIDRNELFYLAVVTGEGPLFHPSLFILHSFTQCLSLSLSLFHSLSLPLCPVPPLMVIEFLHRVSDIFGEYFGEVNEHSIKDNFITVYQVYSLFSCEGVVPGKRENEMTSSSH